MRLYDYWRSSSAYRVRIALRLKGIEHQQLGVNLRLGVQRTLDYLAHNQQGLVPALETGEATLTQSLAIIEYLEETHPTPAFLPKTAAERARRTREPCHANFCLDRRTILGRRYVDRRVGNAVRVGRPPSRLLCALHPRSVLVGAD